MSRTPELDQVLAEVARQAAEQSGPHPEIEVLVAFQEHQLSEPDAQAVREHLQGCVACTTVLLEAANLGPNALDDEEALSPAELDAAWARMRSRPEISVPTDKTSPSRMLAEPIPFPARSQTRAVPGWYHALAAALAAAVIGLSLQVTGLNREITQLTDPQINTVVKTLPDSQTRGGEGEALVVPRDSETVTLLLNPSSLRGPAARTYEQYRAEIVGDHTRWSGTGLKVGAYNAFAVTLWKRRFPSGTYQIRLFGVGAGPEELVGEFTVELKDS